MYFSSLKLFEVLKFFQFLMLFENQFLDTSSNFGAPKSSKSFSDLLLHVPLWGSGYSVVK